MIIRSLLGVRATSRYVFRSLAIGMALAAASQAQVACTGEKSKIPAFRNVVVVVEENQSFDDVIGNPDMPYLNQLAAHGGLARQYYANTHPSINNYFYLTSGHKGTAYP
jgi:acid phosphatase